MPCAEAPPLLDALRDLADLSRLDSEVGALEAEQAELPSRLEACAERRSSSEASLVAARERVVEFEHEQRRLEGEARDHEALLAKLEAQQHQVKNNREYSALLQEMERARESISGAETGVLEAMDELEAAKRGLAKAERDSVGLFAQLEEDERGIGERGQTAAERIAALRERRTALGKDLSPQVMARYEKILARRSPAVAVVSGESCTGCRVGIPPQSYIEILRGESLVVCGQCKRILIHRDHLGALELAGNPS